MSHAKVYGLAVWALAILSVGALACEPTDAELGKDGEQGLITEFLTAEDFDRVIVEADLLCLEGLVRAEFTEPGQMFGFPFTVEAGATVWAATEGDPAFDTVLMVFGPDDGEGYFGRFPVALDDDGGEGLLSVLDEYEIKEDGRYVLLVATYGGEYRGSVNMRLRINGSEGCGGGSVPDLVCCMMPAMPMPYDCEGWDADGDGRPEDCYPRPWPVESLGVLPLEECVAMGGQPAPMELCEPAPVEQVCCRVRWGANDPDCWDEAGQSRCGDEGELFPTGLDECLARGGEPLPFEMCWDEPWPGETVCCLVHDDAAGQRWFEIMPIERCHEANGEVFPDAECGEPGPDSNEPVCCGAPAADGQLYFFLAPMESCLERQGQPVDMGRCENEPEPPELMVCCFLTTPDGTFRTGWMTEGQCADLAGIVASEDLCEARP